MAEKIFQLGLMAEGAFGLGKKGHSTVVMAPALAGLWGRPIVAHMF